MKRALLLTVGALLFSAAPVYAELIEEDTPPAVDNTGPLVSGADQANILEDGGEAAQVGTIDGEVTLKVVDGGVEVYSGLNRVDTVNEGSDAWVGSVKEQSVSHINFQPTGRPELNCPVQALANWFGPCKIIEQESSGE